MRFSPWLFLWILEHTARTHIVTLNHVRFAFSSNELKWITWVCHPEFISHPRIGPIFPNMNCHRQYSENILHLIVCCCLFSCKFTLDGDRLFCGISTKRQSSPLHFWVVHKTNINSFTWITWHTVTFMLFLFGICFRVSHIWKDKKKKRSKTIAWSLQLTIVLCLLKLKKLWKEARWASYEREKKTLFSHEIQFKNSDSLRCDWFRLWAVSSQYDFKPVNSVCFTVRFFK